MFDLKVMFLSLIALVSTVVTFLFRSNKAKAKTIETLENNIAEGEILQESNLKAAEFKGVTQTKASNLEGIDTELSQTIATHKKDSDEDTGYISITR